MAEDLKQHWTSGSDVLTTGLDSLANGSSATSAGQSLGTGAVSAGDQQGPWEVVGMVTVAGASASNTGRCELYLKFSRDGTNYSDDGNDLLVLNVQMNGTSTVLKSYRALVDYPHVQVRLANESGDALASSANTVSLDEIHGDQA